MPLPSISELVTTTLRKRSRKLADNFSVNTALMYKLNEKGKIKTFSGGRTIFDELEYAKNSTYTRYTGYEQLNIQPSDILTAAEYNIKQAAVAVTMSGLEMLQNSGPEQVLDLLEARISNAEATLYDELAADMYSDGTASGGNQIGGLQLLVSDTGLSTVGGLDSNTFSFWRNQVQNAGGTLTSSNIQSNMNSLWLKTCRNGRVKDKINLIVGDDVAYQAYWESLQPIQRTGNPKMADAGFTTLKFMDVDVVLDGGIGGSAPSNRFYYLNTNFLKWRPHKDRNMEPIGSDRFSLNQDSMVKLIGVAGALTCSNRQLQGVLTDN